MADLILVDDDARIADLFAFFLRKAGHDVRTAASLRDARDEIAVRRPDLMLSDLDLRLERGLDVLPELSLEGVLPPTLVVSGWLDDEACARLGALPEVVGALKKPFAPDRLVAAVDLALAAARGVADTGWIEIAPAPSAAEP